MGIKGEPGVPEDPARGLVWTAILDQLDRAGSEGEFVSVADVPQEVFGRHPWSVGGVGASDLRGELNSRAVAFIQQRTLEIGFGCVISEEEAFQKPKRINGEIDLAMWRPLVIGDAVRDWTLGSLDVVLFPYTDNICLRSQGDIFRELWWARTLLGSRRAFGNQTYNEAGRPWWESHQIPVLRNQVPLSITFAFVATHNHFVLDRGGKVFNRSAPVIKLPAGATEDDHLALLGLLNSSTACFWLKQVFHNKGSTVDTKGARQTTDAFENFYEFTGTGLQQFPLAEPYPTDLARRLDALAQQLTDCLPAAVLATQPSDPTDPEQPDD
jgi:hypothetical protein